MVRYYKPINQLKASDFPYVAPDTKYQNHNSCELA